MSRTDAARPDSLTGASLDPEDWEKFRALAHEALDEAVRFLRSVADGPVWRPTPEDVKRFLEDLKTKGPAALTGCYLHVEKR